MTKKQQKIEALCHVIFWLLLFTSVNVDWSANWFDKSIRPKTPAPLSVLIFPIWFYLNAFWLIPKYLKHRKWLSYLGMAFVVFILPEILRSFLMTIFYPNIDFYTELNSRDSLFFGAPGIFFLAMNFSFGYRFSKDWILNRNKIEEMKQEKESLEEAEREKANKPVIAVMTDPEAETLLQNLQQLMVNDKPYLNAKLTLAELAKLANSSDKKLSYVLNQKLDTNFYSYLNSFRIEAFKEQVKEQKNQNLSLVGIAKDCGFKSKSSFYRAFKAEMGMAPTDYIKQNQR